MNISAPSQIATLKIPTAACASGGSRCISCFFEGLSGQRLTLNCQEEPALSSPVSIEYNDAMFLGEVIAVCRRVDGRWHVQVTVEQILTGLQSLISLRDHLLGESAGAGAAVRREEVQSYVYA